MTTLSKTLNIMALSVIFISSITAASSTVYFLPEAKSAGVASSDQKALMFLGMDRDVNLGNDSNLLIVFYVQIMPDDFVMQLHR
ncbi:hypothetical protein RZR35_19585, partial [Citrobacter freundii]|nr:hypothetical protein [Citrobacter freundii]MDV1867965.1 hypothetical protein [Citrobacter freundii]MEB0424010.1 hypothetical protein [Citrobacter freundii]MEB0429159.1 hypothetical protein [Citrobacter freundii]MEB0439552.1 hypothetical protein [Citrobacter freundii]